MLDVDRLRRRCLDIAIHLSILRRCTRLFEGRETLLEIIQALSQVLVHVLRHLHLCLQFLKVFDVDVVPSLSVWLLLHLELLIIIVEFIVCLLSVLRTFLIWSVRSLSTSCALLYALWPVIRHTHFLTTSLELLLIFFVITRSRRSHSLREAAHVVGVGRTVLRRLPHLYYPQVLIDLHTIIIGRSHLDAYCGIVALWRVVTLLTESIFRLNCVVILKAQMTIASEF